ncbi:MAG: NAD(P)-dependent alcohol dehydrogenase [Alphaproteobacteria bacterium]|nr:NAD(P)-dependent alcohol dehydrogenase [Alphaproteobacteria bacterium]
MNITAVVLEQAGAPMRLQTLHMQDPRPDEMRVRVVASGLCHTDISMLKRPFPVDQPIVLGHEGAGVVEAVGAAIGRFKPGDRVLLSYNHCQTCPSCLSHAPSYCHYFFGRNFLGQRPDGTTGLARQGQPVRHHFFGQSTFASHCLVNETNAIPVPEHIDHELFKMLGPMGCGLQTGAGAMFNVLRPEPGQSVVVLGSGAVGMAAIMAARAMGATTIVAVDRVASRLDLAQELGATHGVLANGDDWVARIKALCGGGAHVSLDTTAHPEVLRVGLEVLGPLGRCGFVGGAAPGTTLPVDVRDMMLGGKTLRGIVEGDANAQAFIPQLLRLHARGLFPFERMVRFYPLADFQQAIDDSLSGLTVKPILLP